MRALGLEPSRLSIHDAVRDAAVSVSRAPGRTLLTALGTALGVAAVIATVGLAESARGAVSGTFDALRETQLTFSDSGGSDQSQLLTEQGETALKKLHGVVSAGLMWDVDGGRPQALRRFVTASSEGTSATRLPVQVATPGALATMSAETSNGRLYDEGMERRHDRVALLGIAAAHQLGITQVDRSPAIYLGTARFAVIGIIDSTEAAGEVLLGVTIPPDLAADLGTSSDQRRMIVKTLPGAAQLIGKQGPLALAPTAPNRIQVQVPPDPTTLRNRVESSVTSLLIALALVTLVIGTIAIGNTTLLSVLQRHHEIGLRRAVGAAPRHIAALVLGEAAVVGTIGGIVGASVGVLGIAVTAAAKGWAPVLDPKITLLAPLLGAAVGLLAGAYPSWRASRLTPAAALQR